MFRFLKNNKQYIVIDAGSHKIAAIAFQILDNKPYINQIEHHKSKGIKNNHLTDINAFSSVVKLLIKKNKAIALLKMSITCIKMVDCRLTM